MPIIMIIQQKKMYLWERGEKVFSHEKYCLYSSWNTTKCASNYCENNPTDEVCNETRSKSNRQII